MLFWNRIVQDHWSQMSPGEKETYYNRMLVLSSIRGFVLTLCLSLGLSITMEPQCEKMDTERLKAEKDLKEQEVRLSISVQKQEVEKLKLVENMPSFQIKEAYNTCMTLCYDRLEKASPKADDKCPAMCSASAHTLKKDIQ